MEEIVYKKCLPGHIKYINPQEVDRTNKLLYQTEEFKQAVRENFSISAWVGNQCIGAAGLIQVHPHRAIAWAMLSADAGPYMLSVTRKIKNFFKSQPTKRIEITVLEGFKEGHKWAKLLNFTLETPEGMRGHGVGGETEYLYSRVKE